MLELFPPQFHGEVPVVVAVMEALHGKEPDVPDVEVAARVGEVVRVLHVGEPPPRCSDPRTGRRSWRSGGPLALSSNANVGWVSGGWSGSRTSPAVWTSVPSGLFDFEPAVRGAFEYEFAGVGDFVTKGDRRCWQALVEAYGRVPDARRVMAYALLRVYSNMPWYMREMPAGKRSTTSPCGGSGRE